MTIINLFIFLVILAIIFTYLIYFKDYMLRKIGKEISSLLNMSFQYFKKQLKIWYLRSKKFLSFPLYTNFIQQITDLHVCKVFKWHSCIEKDNEPDIYILTFRILGISVEYQKNLVELGCLISELHQDFIIDWFGCINYPLSYLISIENGFIVFWVARNAYGNQLIKERMALDEERKLPNIGEIEDE